MNLGNDYILEVSTPGIDRKFFNISQLKDFIGNELEFKTKEIINGTRKFNGKLIECDEIHFSVDVKKDFMKFKFSDIDLCKLKPNYNELMKEKNHAKY
jgi:ribosome maturation factor RimP